MVCLITIGGGSFFFYFFPWSMFFEYSQSSRISFSCLDGGQESGPKVSIVKVDRDSNHIPRWRLCACVYDRFYDTNYVRRLRLFRLHFNRRQRRRTRINFSIVASPFVGRLIRDKSRILIDESLFYDVFTAFLRAFLSCDESSWTGQRAGTAS